MEMPDIKLNSHARALFLQHYENQFEEKEVATFKLFRVLLISKKFLRACLRYKSYMYLIEVGADHKFHVYIQDDVKECRYRTQRFELTLDELLEMNSVLGIDKFGLKFHWQHQEDEVIQFSKLCDRIPGNISFELFLFTKQAVLNLAQRVHDRIFQLRCHAKLLAEKKHFSKLNLEYCRASKVEGFEHIKRILTNHRINELNLQFSGINQKEKIPDSFFNDFPVASALHKLQIHYQLHKDDSFMDKTQQMVVFFPRLKELDLFLISSVLRDPKMPELTQHLIEVFEQISKLKDACLTTTKLDISVNFSYSCSSEQEEEESRLVEELKKEEFKVMESHVVDESNKKITLKHSIGDSFKCTFIVEIKKP